MENYFKHIKVKSLAWIENQGMIFVVKMHDSDEPDDYYRPIGGSVEYGETTLTAIKREVHEEIKAEVEVTGEPLVLENLFTCEGKFGHEIDFIYPCRFTDTAFLEARVYPLVEENGDTWDAMWISISDCLNGKYNLVPEALLTWYQNQN